MTTLLIALGTFLFTGLLIGLLSGLVILDNPNPRSSHQNPTPRGGGLALFAALFPFLVFSGGADLIPLWFGLLGLLAVSFADDLFDLPPLPRFAAQIAAVGLGLCSLPAQDFVLTLFAAALWLWFINVFNFMDGIDGLASVETITIGAGAALATALGGPAGGAGTIGLAAAAAAAGFLPWNWSRARIFLGDVGSVPLGYLLGFVLLSLIWNGHGAVAVILPLIFLADATLTLSKRIYRREQVWLPHRTHWYQRAAIATSHTKVVKRVMLANVVLLVLACFAAAEFLALPILIGGALGVVVVYLLELTRLARKRRRTPVLPDEGFKPAPPLQPAEALPGEALPEGSPPQGG